MDPAVWKGDAWCTESGHRAYLRERLRPPPTHSLFDLDVSRGGLGGHGRSLEVLGGAVGGAREVINPLIYPPGGSIYKPATMMKRSGDRGHP